MNKIRQTDGVEDTAQEGTDLRAEGMCDRGRRAEGGKRGRENLREDFLEGQPRGRP